MRNLRTKEYGTGYDWIGPPASYEGNKGSRGIAKGVSRVWGSTHTLSCYNGEMKLRNPFPEEVRNLFLYCYNCFNCGRGDKGLELHHITGRNSNAKENAIPLCPECHSHALHTISEETRYKELNKQWLESQSNQLL